MKMQEWHIAFIEALEEASDIDRQWLAWVGQNNPDVPAPEELVCQIFDDSGVDDLLAEGPVFSEATDTALRRLSALAAEIDLSQEPEQLLSNERWVAFTREAARVLALVRKDLAA